MNQALIKHIIYPALSRMRGENIYAHLAELEKSQWLDRESLNRKQFRDLQSLCERVYEHNEYYRNRFKESNVSNVSSYEDFCALPILEKSELRRDIKKMISADVREKIETRKTSGSTGIPLEILKSRDSFGRIRALFHRYYKWFGIAIGDKQARLFGHPTAFLPRLKEDLQDFLLNKYRLDPVFLTKESMMRFYKALVRVKPHYFYGYPSAVHEFCKFLNEEELKLNCPLKAVITTGETLYDFQRELMKNTLKTSVVNEYGCSECGIIAFGCERGRMHLSEDNLFIEIIKDGKPAKAGEVGEVVVTELYNYSVPLIRYRIGDLAKVAECPHCDCGRGLACIESIEGRTSQFITVGTARKVHTELFSYIADGLHKGNGAIEQFRVIQNKNLAFTVEYVSDTDDTKDALDYLLAQFKRFLGEDIQCHFARVDTIPRDTSGKLRYFVSELES